MCKFDSILLRLLLLILVWGGSPLTSSAQGISDRISQEITRNIPGAIGQNVEARLYKPELLIKHSAGGIEGMQLSGTGNTLVAVPSDGTVRIWDLSVGVLRSIIRPQSEVKKAIPSFDGTQVVVATNDGRLDVYDAVSGKLLNTLTHRKREIDDLTVSPDGQLAILSSTDGAVQILDLTDPSQKRTVEYRGGNMSSVVFSRSGSLLAAATREGDVYVWDAVDGRIKTKTHIFSERMISLQFAESEEFIACVSVSGKVAIMDLAVGKVTTRFNGPRDIRSFAISADSSLAAFGTEEGSIRIYDLDRGEERRRLDGHSGVVTGISFIKHDVISAGRDGLIRVWDTELGENILRIIMTDNGWAVVDRQGRFDGSEQGLNEVTWHARGKDLGFDQFADQFFEPGLLATHILANQEFASKAPSSLQEGVPLPPLVEIDFPDQHRKANRPFKVIVIATAQGNSIESVRLYHNGKLVQPGSFLQQQDFGDGEDELRAAAFQVKPVTGLNTFRAVATGLWGVEGRSEGVTQNFVGPVAKTPKLFVLAVGINNYSSARMRLSYAVPDAISIIDAFKDTKKGAYSDVIVHRLFDSDATKENILLALDELKDTTPDDVIVFYYAGHGVATNQEWVLLPYEVQVDHTMASYVDQGVTATQLQSALVQASAHRVLVMIDSCYSGTGVETFEKMQNFQRRFLNKFSRLSGIAVLAATRRDQNAMELHSLGHGLFTYLVLKGLSGEADLMPSDGNVSAHEIIRYAAREIPAFSKEYLGESQVPTAFALGSDFIVGRP